MLKRSYSPDRTLDTYDFGLETPEADAMAIEAIRYIDEVLQVEAIARAQSVQRHMSTPAFTQGRIVNTTNSSGIRNMRCTIFTAWCWTSTQVSRNNPTPFPH